jgi:hypothetical protein
VLAGPIAQLCNISLCAGVFPDLFKEALVHPVHRGSGKDHREPGSYRPISILPALSKVLEVVVRYALMEWLDLRGVLPDSQFGFRPGSLVCFEILSIHQIHATSYLYVGDLPEHNLEMSDKSLMLVFTTSNFCLILNTVCSTYCHTSAEEPFLTAEKAELRKIHKYQHLTDFLFIPIGAETLGP